MELTMQQSFLNMGGLFNYPKYGKRQGKTQQKMRKMANEVVILLYCIYITYRKLKTETRWMTVTQYMMPCSWKSGSPEKGQLWRNGRVTACLADSFLWPGLLAMFGLAGTVSTSLLDVTVTVLVLWTFCLTHSMHHSERCKVSSETVVSVTIQRMFFRNL